MKNDLLFSWIIIKKGITNYKENTQRRKESSKSRLYNKIKKSLEKNNYRGDQSQKILRDLNSTNIYISDNNISPNNNKYN